MNSSAGKLKLTIVYLDKITIGNVPNLQNLNELGQVRLYDTTTPAELGERIQDAHVIITNKVVIDKTAMDLAPFLKLICVSATGMNNVDLDYAAKKGIPVKNVIGYSTNSVAQSTFAMLLYLMQQLRYYDHYVKSGQYIHSPVFTHMGPEFREIAGKTFGIIGLGAIGKKVASIARAFGAHVIYYSTSGKNNDSSFLRKDLNELLAQSDVISIHAPLNENTRNLIDLDKLKRMKPAAILINAGRGGIVNEHDLAGALNNHLIYAAALDVLTIEPIAADNPLLTVKDKDRILIMPHVAWASVEARILLVDRICENIANHFSV